MKNNFPESELTILLTNPYFEENARFGEHLEDSIYGVTYEAFKEDRHEVISANAKLSAERFPLGENRPKFIFINGLSLLNQGDAKGCISELKTVVLGSSSTSGDVSIKNTYPDKGTLKVTKTVKVNGEKVNYVSDVDQINVTDPVEMELAALRAQIAEISGQRESDGSGI